MLPGERLVAGVRCSEVMADLSAYVDRELLPARAAQLEAHVAECQACSRFGAEFNRLLDAVRARLTDPEPLPDDVAHRLRGALEASARRE